MSGSALYLGHVVHTRLKPVRHRLRYRTLYMLLELDELPLLARRLRLFSLNRFNLFSFHDRDHGAGSDVPLRQQLDEQLRRAGIELAGGPIRILCMPRILGMVFNPLSLYFCHRADGRLAAILYEVNNTFGERHSYLLPVTQAAGPGSPLQQSCAKRFYVSPFMAMALRYRFRLALPGDRLGIAIRADDPDGPVLRAVLGGTRAALSDTMLARVFLRYPLLALQVLGAIHWEALKLWRKGLRIRPRPAPPHEPVTISRSLRSAL